jgi:hypothetical protein
MSGEEDDETLIASKDWMAQQPFNRPPAAGPAQPGYPGAMFTLRIAPNTAPELPPAAAPEIVAAPEGAFGAPPFVMTFLLVSGVLTALGLVALIYLEM